MVDVRRYASLTVEAVGMNLVSVFRSDVSTGS